MTLDRREVLIATAAAAAATLGRCAVVANAASAELPSSPDTTAQYRSVQETFVPNPIAVSTYSFWRFNDDSKLDMVKCIDLAARYGFDAVELLRIQMEDVVSDAYLQQLKRQAFVNGLSLCGMSTHQDFVTPDADDRAKNVKLTVELLEMAYKLGIPTIRVNTGRWNTSKDFDELMANKGIEPVMEGHTDEEGFKWVIDSFEQCLPTAEKCGVTMGLENHWGLGRTAEGVLRVVDALKSPWMKVTLDTGNFFERRYEQIEMLAPQTAFVQAKTYFGGGKWYELETDWPRIAKTLQSANYHGFISLEFEGKEDYNTAIPKSLAVLREAFGKKYA